MTPENDVFNPKQHRNVLREHFGVRVTTAKVADAENAPIQEQQLKTAAEAILSRTWQFR